MERIVSELTDAARRLGIEVREVALPYSDPPIGSGLVTLKGKRVLFLDPKLLPEEAAELLAQALQGLDLEDTFLSPAARAYLEERS